MFKSQDGKFSSVFGTSKDKKNQETTLPLAYRELGSKKVCKILFDCLTWHLMSGRKSPYLLQLMMAAQSSFNIITDSSVIITEHQIFIIIPLLLLLNIKFLLLFLCYYY